MALLRNFRDFGVLGAGLEMGEDCRDGDGGAGAPAELLRHVVGPAIF